MAKFKVVLDDLTAILKTGKTDRIEILCDLIDHDMSGDIRFYDYLLDATLERYKLVAKFESHTVNLLTLDYIE